MGPVKIGLASRIAPAYNLPETRPQPTELPNPNMTSRMLSAGVAIWFALSGAAWAQNVDPEASAIWQKVRADLFSGMAIGAGDNVIALETPKRAEDAAVVPIAIRAQFPQAQNRYIEKLWLIIDNNPSPIAAVFHFTPESGRADIETRIRVEQYSHIRAIALTNDGQLYMATNYIKASGGCSAPSSKDAVAARATLGKMRLRVDDSVTTGQPVLAQLMISHPNDSGLAMDQLTRLYTPPHFVRSIEVRYEDKVVLSADVDFSISENPNFRFYFIPGKGQELDVNVVDNQDLRFATRVKLDPTRVGAVSTPR
jgi:sulfur-oxidizing protein SoxY